MPAPAGAGWQSTLPFTLSRHCCTLTHKAFVQAYLGAIMPPTLNALLKSMVEQGGSDLHITTNSPPLVRVDGVLKPLNLPPLTPTETKQLCYSILTDNQKHRLEEDLEIDLSFGIKSLARFRANVFHQRELHADTHSFPNALRAALRQDPDVVLIGEMRDFETVETALRIAETGHLTFATLHTNSAAQTINRIIDIFPAHQQSQIRVQLSFVLEGIMCQTLLPRANGQGRVLALEIMIPNSAIRNLIREDKVHQIYSVMQTGQAGSGMQTFNQSLSSLYQRKLITLQTALSRSSLPDELQDMINRGTGTVGAQASGGGVG